MKVKQRLGASTVSPGLSRAIIALSSAWPKAKGICHDFSKVSASISTEKMAWQLLRQKIARGGPRGSSSELQFEGNNTSTQDGIQGIVLGGQSRCTVYYI